MADAFLTRKGGEDVTPEVQAQEVLIDDIMTALVGKVQGANATADKILAGYKAYVGRELIEGTYEPGIDILAATGCTKYAIDTFTFSSDTSITPSLTLSHSLGAVPKLVLILSASQKLADYKVVEGIGVNMAGNSANYIYMFNGYGTSSNGSFDYTSTGLKPRTNLGSDFIGGVEYTLITMA